MSACKTCGQAITWAKTSAGKNMPLDPPETMFVVEGGVGETVTCKPVQARKSHFSTCPQADQYRRK